ncbi:hypothetical protein HAX54_004674, partial [Datura stramonium]|nr:hypothetical protein [Datura stramonium]
VVLFEQKDKIERQDLHFKQIQGEQLFEAWEHFKQYLLWSSNYEFPENFLLEKSYMGLDPMNQSIDNSATRGCFMDKTFKRASNLMDKVTKYNQA